MTQRINGPFLNITNRAVFEDDSKNWTFLENVTRRILFLKITKHFFEKTQRINLWFYDSESKNWTFFLNVTQRIPFVKYDSNGTFFQIWHEELNFFLSLTQGIELFSSNMTQRIENPSFLEYDASTWTFFQNMTQRIELFLKILLIWLKDLNSFCYYDSKNWIQKKKRLKELILKEKRLKRIELFLFWLRLKEWNSFLIWLKELTYFQYDSKYWIFQTKIMTPRILFS